MDALDIGMIHVPDNMELDGTRFHHANQNDTQFKTCKLFISEIFPFNIFRAQLTASN